MKIITDTGSDILEIEAKAMGVDLVPISANFEDVIFDRNTEENFKAFMRNCAARNNFRYPASHHRQHF